MSTNAEAVKEAIDTYLSKTSFLPGNEALIVLYVDEVLGFKKAGEEMDQIVADADGAVTKEEVEVMLEEQKQETIKKLKDPDSGLKKQFEAKVNDLKALLSEIAQLVAEMSKQLAQSIAAALMPTMISIGTPNPFYVALKIILDILAIKRVVDTILRAVSKVLGSLFDLGLEKTDIADKITGLVQPILSLKAELDAKEKEQLDELAKDDFKQKFKVNVEGTEVGAQVLEGKAREFGVDEFPLRNKDIRKINKVIRKAEDDDEGNADAWGKAILQYNDFLIRMALQKVSQAGGINNTGSVGQQ